MSNPHPDRPIAVPKRRTNRTTSFMSAGSQGTPPATTSPLAGFSFGNTSAPLTAAKPPATAPPNFNTGFGNPSLTGFNTTGFPAPATSAPTTPTAANTTTNTGFGGFSGFGNTNITPSPFGSTTPTTAATAAPTTPTAATPAFGNGFGTPTTNSPFAGFSMTAQTPKANETPSPFSFGTPVNAPTPVISTGFSFSSPATTTAAAAPTKDDTPIKTSSSFAGFTGPPKPVDNASGKTTFTFNPPATTTTTTNAAQQGGFSFGTPVKSTSEENSNEKPSPFGASPFQPTGGFGFKPTTNAESTTTNKDETTKDTNAKKNDEPASTGFSFGTPAKETTEKPSFTPSTGFSFGKPKEDTTTEKKPTFSFGTPAEKPVVAAAPAAATASPFGTPATTSDQEKPAAAAAASPFSFGTPKVSPATTATAASSSSDAEKPKLFSSFGAAPAKDTEKPSPFSFGTPAKSTNEAEKEKPSPFSFGSPAKPTATTTNTEPEKEKASPFSFGTPAKSTEPEKEKSTPFSFGTPAAEKADKEKPSPFSFGTPITKPSNNEAEKEKPSPFSFGTPTVEKADKAKPFTFGTPATPNEAQKEKPSPFSFGTPAKSTESTEKPSPFSFGTPPTVKPTENAPKASPFTFGAPPAKTTEEKKEESEKTAAASKPFTFNLPPSGGEAAKPFSFGNPTDKAEGSKKKRQLDRDGDEDGPSSSKRFTMSSDTASKPSPFNATNPKTTFSFGAPPAEKDTKASATTSQPPLFSLAGSKDKSTSEKKSSDTPFSFASSSTSASKEPSKAPVISFGNASSTKETETEAEKKTTTAATSSSSSATSTATVGSGGKKVTFGGSTPVVVETPGSADLAFSKSSTTASDVSGPLSLSTTKKDASTSSERPVQTTLKSTVTEPSQITYKTCFWELPDEARNELALLANFITEQTDMHDKIADELNSSFGPDLTDFGIKALSMDNDAQILRKQLEVQGESLHELISKNKEQRLNAVAASNVQKQDTKDWRTRGAFENWTFFANTIEQMENRLQQFTQATESIQDAVNGLQKDAPPTPEAIGHIVQQQQRMYLSLAGRVAELHQEADRVFKRRKIN